MKKIKSNKNHRISTACIPRYMRIKPINPKDFADSMKKRIKSLNPGFYCGGKIRAGFIQYCYAYNDCVDLNSKGKSTQIVIPAATGSGKTVSAILYLSQIAKMKMSGLLVVSEVIVAIKAAEIINNLAGEEVAGAYYSISNKNPLHKLWHPIHDLPPIAIITHAMFIQRSDSGKDIDLLKSFHGKQRDIVIIDERIDLIKRINFGTDEINDAIAILKRDPDLQLIAEMLTNFNEVMFITKTNGTYEYKGKFQQSHKDLNKQLLSLVSNLYAGNFNILPRIRGKIKNTDPDRANIIDLLNRVAYVIDGRYTHTIQGNKVVCHREENLSSMFGSVVVLDATSQVNPEYEYRAVNGQNIVMLNRITSRNYSNVTLNICSFNGPKQSKTAIYKTPKRKNQLKNIILAYLKVISSTLKPNDNLLVVTYKNVVPLFEDNNPHKDQVKFIHWGSKDARGSNAFQNFNKAMVIGWFRKPMHTYVSSVMAINQFENYVSINGSVWSDANYLKDMQIVDDMIQFFNRVRCRTAINKNGNCLPVELYCLTGGNSEMEKIIRILFESEMPNIVISDWEPKGLKVLRQKVMKDEKRAELFIKWLRGKIEKYDEIYLSELRQEFGLKSNTVSRIINSAIFNDLLEEEGITITKAKGKGNPVRFILPKYKV